MSTEEELEVRHRQSWKWNLFDLSGRNMADNVFFIYQCIAETEKRNCPSKKGTVATLKCIVMVIKEDHLLYLMITNSSVFGDRCEDTELPLLSSNAVHLQSMANGSHVEGWYFVTTQQQMFRILTMKLS